MIGLRARFVGVVLAVLGVLLAAIAAVVLLRAEHALAELESARFSALTAQLGDSVRYGILARSPVLLAPALDVFARTPELVRVELFDDVGALIEARPGTAADRHASGLSAYGRDRDPLRVTVEVSGGGLAPGDAAGELAAFGLTASAPRTIGRVVADFSDASAARLQSEVRTDVVAAFVVFGGAGLLVIAALASQMVRRVRRLADAAARVAGGDLDVRVAGPGRDELAALARDFDAMTTALGVQRAQLEAAGAALADREALAAIGRATAVIAHELRNPLGILLGAAPIVANLARPEAARQRAAAIIEEEVRRLERTLGALLDHAKPRPPAFGVHSVRELCLRAAERATLPGGPAVGVGVEVFGPDVKVRVDEHHIAQILLNLLANAAQAGARRIEVEIAPTGQTGPTARTVRIEVRDDGRGVATELRDTLFRPFVSTRAGGAGLGLAASRRMARDNNGDLRLACDVLSDRAGPGACFLLELPESP